MKDEAKVVERDETTKLVSIITRSKLNLELMSYSDDDGETGILARCRPYARAKNTGAMLVGYGSSVADAVKEVSDALRNNDWVELDWAWRPGTYNTLAPSETALPDKKSYRKAGY